MTEQGLLAIFVADLLLQGSSTGMMLSVLLSRQSFAGVTRGRLEIYWGRQKNVSGHCWKMIEKLLTQASTEGCAGGHS